MADDKHTVELEIVANAKKVREEIGEVAKQVKKLDTLSSNMQKAGLKGHKQVSKVSKEAKKEGSKKAKEALGIEKKLQAEIQKTAKAMESKAKARKASVKALGQELKHIKKLEQENRKLQRARGGGGAGGGRGAAGGGGRGGFGSGLGGFMRGVGGSVLGAAAAAGGALLRIITSQLTSGFSAKQQYGQAQAGLVGMGGSNAALKRATGLGVDLGYKPIETAQQARQVGRQTGSIKAVTTAQRISRMTGADVGEAGGLMGTLARGGADFSGRPGTGSGERRTVKLLAAGFESGLQRARMPEYMQSVSKLVEGQAAVRAGDVDPSGIAEIMSALGQSGKSGLQGARGAAVFNKLDRSVKAPGGGEAGQAFVLRAMGFGQPGGETSYYEALRSQQRGITGEGGPERLKKIFEQSRMEFGGGDEQALALNKLTGLTIDQVEAVRDVVNSNLDNEEQTKKIREITKESKSIEEKMHASLEEFGETAQHHAQLQEKSIRMGEAIEESVHKMQDLLQQLVLDLLPPISLALRVIVDVLRDLYDYLKSLPFSPEDVKKDFQQFSKRSVADIKMARMDVRSGKMSPAEFSKLLKDKAKEFRSRAEEEAGDISILSPINTEFYSLLSGQGSIHTERRRVEATAKQTAKKLDLMAQTVEEKYANFENLDQMKLAKMILKHKGINLKHPSARYVGDTRYEWGYDTPVGEVSPGAPAHALIESLYNKLIEEEGSAQAAVKAFADKLNEGEVNSKRPKAAEVDKSGGAH